MTFNELLSLFETRFRLVGIVDKSIIENVLISFFVVIDLKCFDNF